MIQHPSLDEAVEAIGQLGRSRCYARPEQRFDLTHPVDMRFDRMDLMGEMKNTIVIHVEICGRAPVLMRDVSVASQRPYRRYTHCNRLILRVSISNVDPVILDRTRQVDIR